MALTAADKTRIYKYKAFRLGANASGLTSGDVLELIQQQMDNIDAIDLAQGTTFATEIQADLDTLDTLDASLTTEQGSSSAGLKKADVLEWFPGGKTDGFSAEMGRIADRVARVLSQSFEDDRAMAGMTMLERA